MKVILQYEGGGKFHTSSIADTNQVNEKFKAGDYMAAELVANRSLPQLRLFWAVINKAFENQRQEPKFDDLQRFRYYVLVRAGHFTEMFFEAGAMTKEVSRGLAEFHPDLFFFVVPDHGIRAKKAKSISFKACDANSFIDIMPNVLDVIVTEIVPGITIEQLLDEVASMGEQAKLADQVMKKVREVVL